MSQRIYFLVNSLSDADSVVSLLKNHDVPESEMGVVSHQDSVELAELPEADILEQTDVINSLQRGATTGAATGLVAGIVAAVFPPSGLVIGGAALLGMTGAGAAIGAWSASLIGVSEQHPLLEQFESRINNGCVLVLADVEEDKAAAIAAQVGQSVGLVSEDYGVFEAVD